MDRFLAPAQCFFDVRPKLSRRRVARIEIKYFANRQFRLLQLALQQELARFLVAGASLVPSKLQKDRL